MTYSMTYSYCYDLFLLDGYDDVKKVRAVDPQRQIGGACLFDGVIAIFQTFNRWNFEYICSIAVRINDI